MSILIDTDVIKKNCAEIETQLDYMDTNINALKNTVNNMGYKWKGPDYDFFNEKMQAVYKSLYDMIDSIGSYKDFLNGYFSTVEKLHKYYENKKVDIK